MFEKISSAIGSLITPFVLFTTSIFLLSVAMKTLTKRNKKDRTKKEYSSHDSLSSFRAFTLALAGTLGVGNITGVASALICGGAGAVFWMWVGAFAVTIIKYAEVYLALLYRRQDKYGYYGGAMYYIREGLSAPLFGGVFAVLCVANSLVTGNIVQSNAASSMIAEISRSSYRVKTGVILALLVLASIIYGTRRIEKISAYLIPPLSVIYIAMTLFIIIENRSLIPDIFKDIFSSAFSARALLGTASGYSMREAVRYGIMRGIFSNEAGCGTSPTAHASANASSPKAQGRLGIAEVIFDTPILCTLTSLALLIADKKYSVISFAQSSDSAKATLNAFESLGNFGVTLSFLIVLFAYATIIAQIYYGNTAIGYLTSKKRYRYIYYALSVICTVTGSVISPELMWQCADILLGAMTVLNCISLILLQRELQW